ncbi:hypothetical protein INR49_007325 [Caranx melampygus]|nr:hypothetical protein INR49_007325 [Caranx melampygus]
MAEDPLTTGAVPCLWMEVCSSTMGPERVLPSSEDELGEDERPADGALLPGGPYGTEEEEVEEEEQNSGGYYYQPLNQEPDGVNGTEGEEEEEEEDRAGQRVEEAGSHAEQLQQVQQRIEVMGLHLPEAPPLTAMRRKIRGGSSLRSRASIPMDADHVELVKRTMAAVALPSLGVPAWAGKSPTTSGRTWWSTRCRAGRTLAPCASAARTTSTDPERTITASGTLTQGGK